MRYPFSKFGERLALRSGIGELMRDLGDALASSDASLCMLGGGQPSHIAAVDQIWQRRLQEIAADSSEVAKVLGDYQPPAGDATFRRSVAQMFRRQFGWDIDESHVGISSGGQTAFFLLLNAFAGRFSDGSSKKVLLPILPEYIGYADQSSSDSLFKGLRPKIQRTADHEFKYSIDFDALEITDDIAAICLSRPTNPSSNVVTDHEIEQLADIAIANDIPLFVDNAYGNPFPGAIFTETRPIWKPGMVLTYSLSKLGLPGTRTGIVIAEPEVIDALAEMNAIASLANNNVGQAIIKPLIDSDELLGICRDHIRPYYQQRSEHVRQWTSDAFDDSVPYRIHRSEGAFFVWLWLEGLPITSQELYERLKTKGVLVISGHHFFFGLDDAETWTHRNECLRISFTAPEEMLRRGICILADEVNELFGKTAS